MKKMLICAGLMLSAPVMAQVKDWKLGAVLDVAYTSKELGLGQRQSGLALGHSDVMAQGPLGDYFSAQFGVATHSHEKKIETELEEVWLQTRALPFGLQARVGRFGSQIGYQNEQHPHADDFSERPLLYRAFLGGHWFDDGLRLNWTAPTALYLSFGAEVFRGKQLVQEAMPSRQFGIGTLTAKLGGDVGLSHSWQVGLSRVHNKREALLEDEHDHREHEGEEHGEEEHGEGHKHAHGALFQGKKMWMADLTWKWSPDGNNQREQIKFNAEFARVSQLNRFASPSDKHYASSISLVWRFDPSWEIGGRMDRLKVSTPHGDHFHPGRLKEDSVSLAWKQSHRQVVRLQVARQRDAYGMENVTKRSVQLQTIFSFGAHGAHTF